MHGAGTEEGEHRPAADTPESTLPSARTPGLRPSCLFHPHLYRAVRVETKVPGDQIQPGTGQLSRAKSSKLQRIFRQLRL